ncbi:MAG: endonuclease/exonuclease/phosphatase family protein [Lachnospiraceae bacterium]|nr:endonuclease/exonuclease/phosphatase family protein [Lachnospiraceae bacterium]
MKDILKIIEWNINHRLGHSRMPMPIWVAEEIRNQHSDIAIITECSKRTSNWKKVCSDAFNSDKYLLLSSNNDQVGNNDVIIAVNREKIEVISYFSFLAKGHTAPDNLILKCQVKNSDELFTIVGLRIHAMNISDKEKLNQFQLVLGSIPDGNVIIAGDFNCNRRSFVDKDRWNITAIDNIIRDSYIRKTPEGASWARDVNSQDDYCFALDHFIVKGISDFEVKPYYRSFVNREPKIYKWGTNFQTKYGWEKPENQIPAPYPDHAILSAEFSF